MDYLLLIYEDEKRIAEGFPAAEREEYRAFNKEFEKAIRDGKRLAPTNAAATVRVREGRRLVTDGPFAETREQLGGYFLIDANDLDEAIGVAGRIPGARKGTVEVRPVLEIPGLP
ncbi:MAG: YciI family protein [Acidobacteriota bacterium]